MHTTHPGVSQSSSRRTAVVIGGGFAGLRTARNLARADLDVVVIDRCNYHLFQPLLYQVATAALNPSDIAYPIRAVLRHQRNTRTLMAEATAIDLDRKQVELKDGEGQASTIHYDWLVVATGATHSYFGHDDWAARAPGLKTIEDALEIRRQVLLAYERSELDPRHREAWLTFVVVGAGPTGVELAGALAEIARHSLRRDFRAIDPLEAKVLLIEGSDRVLPPYPAKLSASARTQLESLGVEVRTDQQVTAMDSEGVTLGSGERIIAKTVLWAAGVKGSKLAQTLGVPLDRAGRVPVKEDLSVPGHREAFVIGDLAAVVCDGKPVPGVAPAAIQAGTHTARCIRADLAGKTRPAFRYRDKGSLATIGWARAVADLGRLKFSGFFAWLAWMGIHVFFLIGFRNRLFVLAGWAWNYLTFRRGARLITQPHPASGEPTAAPPRPPTSTSPADHPNRGQSPRAARSPSTTV